MPELVALRAARQRTRRLHARTFPIAVVAVSQLEQRTDVYLSTLENFSEAMCGHLETSAVFLDGKVKLGLEREKS